MTKLLTMEMTLKIEENLQENGGELSAHNGKFQFVRTSEADEHGELGPAKDSVSEEKQPLVSDNDISPPRDPELHKDGRHDMGDSIYNKELSKEPKITSGPNSHLLEHRAGFLDRSSIIGPLNLLASALTPPAMARCHDFSKRITTLQKQQNSTYFSELQRMNVTICQAVFNRTGKSRQELTLDKGDILQVLDSHGDWWKLKNYKGEVGHAPYIMLQVVLGPDMEQKPKPYFSRRKHLIVIVISIAIIVVIIIIGVMQIKRPPIV